MEVEKKYLLPGLPAVELGEGVLIKQGYLVTEQGELRVRQKGEKCYITVKGDGTLSRDEWEAEVPQWVFETLWLQTEGARVEKTRYSIEHEGLTLELDEYYEALAGLVTLECEFAGEEEANSFALPQWAMDAVDVTANKAYKNKALAVKGLPKV